MPTAERPKPMHVRRTILCLVAISFWAAHDPDMASAQSPELIEAFNSYNTLYQQGRCAEAEPPHQRALTIREKALGPEHPDVAGSLNNLAKAARQLCPGQGQTPQIARNWSRHHQIQSVMTLQPRPTLQNAFQTVNQPANFRPETPLLGECRIMKFATKRTPCMCDGYACELTTTYREISP